MGLRLYVTTSEEKDKCFGKLFGYPGDAVTVNELKRKFDII